MGVCRQTYFLFFLTAYGKLSQLPKASDVKGLRGAKQFSGVTGVETIVDGISSGFVPITAGEVTAGETIADGAPTAGKTIAAGAPTAGETIVAGAPTAGETIVAGAPTGGAAETGIDSVSGATTQETGVEEVFPEANGVSGATTQETGVEEVFPEANGLSGVTTQDTGVVEIFPEANGVSGVTAQETGVVEIFPEANGVSGVTTQETGVEEVFPEANGVYIDNNGIVTGTSRIYTGNGAYPGTNGVFPGTHGVYPGTTGGFPGTNGVFPGTTGGFPGTNGVYPGTTGGFPGTNGGYPGTTDFGTVISYPGTNGVYPGTDGGTVISYPTNGVYPTTDGGFPGTVSYPTDGVFGDIVTFPGTVGTYPDGWTGNSLRGANKPYTPVRETTDDPNYRRRHSQGHPSTDPLPKHLRAACYSEQKRMIRVLVFADASFCANVGGSNKKCVSEATGVVQDASEMAYEPQFNIRLVPIVVTEQNVGSYNVVNDGLLSDPACMKRTFKDLHDRLYWANEWCRQINAAVDYGLCTLLTGCAKGAKGPTGVAMGGFCNSETVSATMDGVSARRFGKGGAVSFATAAHEFAHNLGGPHTCISADGMTYGDTPFKWRNCGLLGNGYINDGNHYGFNEEATSAMCHVIMHPSARPCILKDDGKAGKAGVASPPSTVTTPPIYVPHGPPTPVTLPWVRWGPRNPSSDPAWCTHNVKDIVTWCQNSMIQKSCPCLCSQVFPPASGSWLRKKNEIIF